jgi:hypothetical protein
MTPQSLSTAFAALAEGAVAARLDDLGLLCIDGADATAFLHGQLSSDVQSLAAGACQRSSYNSPKGRVLANLLLWRPGETEYRAVLAADLAAAVARRLAMFVLRAKATVRDAGSEHVAIGVAGPRAAQAVHAALGVGVAAGKADAFEHGGALGLSDGRVLLEVTRAHADAAMAALDAHAMRVDAAMLRYARIRAGVPLVTAATSDQFVPQALNWELLGGVNFQKGCYPGQEIVARMQYLGRLKERLFAFRVDAQPPAAGARLYAASFGDQACGTVIDAAPHPHGGAALLAVVQRSAVEGETARLGAPDGPALEVLPLPYAVPEPAAPRGRMG